MAPDGAGQGDGHDLTGNRIDIYSHGCVMFAEAQAVSLYENCRNIADLVRHEASQCLSARFA